jgi:hypothetical protein
VWDGTKDVGRNESILGIHVLKHFVNSLKHTNVIVIKVPHRHDLSPNSCVNQEVQVFNRRLDKLKKAYLNLSVVTVDSARDLFTRHGLHLNAQGKEHIASREVTVINDLFSINKSLPIVLKWKDMGDIQRDPAAKQLPCVEIVVGSDCDKMSQPLPYLNCDFMEQLEGDVTTRSNVANHAPTLVISQENICLKRVGVQEELGGELNNQINIDNYPQKSNSLPPKRTRRQPSKISKDFLR